MIGFLMILVALAAVVMLVIGIYNQLVSLRQNVYQGGADIDAQLRQRHDLIPQLVSTVKGYAAHEQETLNKVISARNNAAHGGVNSNDEAQLRVALDSVLALGEAYPDLKASANFQKLQSELAEVEDKLAAARRALNAAVSRYNTGRESFPAILFASLFGFEAADFQRLDDSEQGRVDRTRDVSF